MINLFRTTPAGTELDRIQAVLNSRWWSDGATVREFEKQFASYVGAKHAVAMNSCSSALDIAVRVVDLPDVVTVSPLTFVSSALCILHAGKQVKFIDIEAHSLCTPKADIQVLYAGNDYGEGTIYDMAHFGGGIHKGLVSCWSFQARKNLPTGDGGMLTTNDERIAKHARDLSWCGINQSTFERSKGKYKWDYDIQEIGIRAEMNNITAAIGLSQLERLGDFNRARRFNAALYNKYLSEYIKRPFPSTTWHLYVIRVQNRDQLIQKLADNDIEAGVHYKPLYRFPIFPADVLPNAEQAFHEIISLPMHTELSENDIKKICLIINEHISQ